MLGKPVFNSRFYPNGRRYARKGTFRWLVDWACDNDVYVERSGRKITYWRKGEDYTEGEANTVREAYDDIAGSFIK